MKLYDKQKTFEIKQFAKELLVYHKPYFSDGNFVFNEKYLKVANGRPKVPAADRWHLQNKIFNTITPDLHKIVAGLAPTNPDDEKLIPCCMELMLRGNNNFSLICQQFSYEADGEERIKYVNVDFLRYINIKDRYFRTTASPTSPIIIYDINTSEFVGLILPIIYV